MHAPAASPVIAIVNHTKTADGEWWISFDPPISFHDGGTNYPPVSFRADYLRKIPSGVLGAPSGGTIQVYNWDKLYRAWQKHCNLLELESKKKGRSPETPEPSD